MITRRGVREQYEKTLSTLGGRPAGVSPLSLGNVLQIPGGADSRRAAAATS